MYRRGPYYKPRCKLAFVRQNAALTVVCALFAGFGLSVIPAVASAWNAHRHNDARQTSVGHKAAVKSSKAANAQTPSTVATAAPNPAAAGIIVPIVGNILDLLNPSKKELAMRLVSSAENSSLDWKAQYGYIEDIGDGRGFTGGIVGFCSGTGDMLELVQYYTQLKPVNPLSGYVTALKQVNGTDSHIGLGPSFVTAWKAAASDPVFQQAQNYERDRVYFDPAITQAKADGLHALGQFIYYDAMVMHGPGDDPASFGGLRASVIRKVRPPSQGGNETAYLNAFLDARKTLMLTEAAHDDTSRVDNEQRVFLNAGNLNLDPPLTWKTYGDAYTIVSNP